MHATRTLLTVSFAASFAFALGFGCGEDDPDGIPTSGNTASSSSGMGGSMTTASSSNGNGGMGGATNSGTGGGPTGYPAGPYGNQQGDTFPFLTWEGYISTNPSALANTETWTDTYTSLDLHNSGAGYALVHTALAS